MADVKSCAKSQEKIPKCEKIFTTIPPIDAANLISLFNKDRCLIIKMYSTCVVLLVKT